MEQGRHRQEWALQWRHPVEGRQEKHVRCCKRTSVLLITHHATCFYPAKQYEDLEDSMTDALINDKPQFVRLFAENGLNILSYLTYGRLETLYRSVAVGTVLFHLLQRCLVERLGTAAFVPSNAQDSPSKAASENVHSGPMSEISLFEVGSSGRRHSLSWVPEWK